MRRLAALVITLGLAWTVVVGLGPASGSSATFGLGVVLIGAAGAGWLCQFARLPSITGYLIFGLLAGPSLANLITSQMARDLQAVSTFAVVAIAVIAGLHINLRRLRGHLLAVLGLSALTMVGAWVALSAGLYVLWPWLPVASDLTDGARLAAATLTAMLLVGASPAVTIAVIAEGRSRGTLSDLATEVVVLMEIAIVVLFAASQAISRAAFGTTVPNVGSLAAAAGWSLLGAGAFGAAAGAVFMAYLKYVGREVTVVLLILCVLLSGAASPFGFEPFLAGLAAGLVIQNVRPETGDVLHDAAEQSAMPALVLFFAASGASMHVEALATVGFFAVVITALRIASVRLCSHLAARLTGAHSLEAHLVWRALVPTAGTTLGLLALAAVLPGWGPRLQALIVAVVAVNQLIGPIIFRATLAQVGEIGRGGGGLIVVSNREPWAHEWAPDGSIRARPSPGGVSVVLDALMRERGGVWIAHGSGDADRAVVDSNSSVEVPPEAPAYRLRRVWLSPIQQERYYAGFSNGALWPLCHLAHVRPVFKEEEWEAYQGVNRLFAETIALEAPPRASVFLNDYHLAVAGGYLRARRDDLRTALFWHIPWPDLDRLRICPWRREILQGVLANDLVAFQLPRDQKHFVDAAIQELGATGSGDTVYLGSRPVRVVPIPIGADIDRISAILTDEALPSHMFAMTRDLSFEGKIVGVGIDRLDYTKGIPERLGAIARALREQPDLRGRLVFVQVGVPSRSEVHGYAELSAEIDALVDNLNREFRSESSVGPVLYLKKALQLPELVALYRLADFCVVSSLHDGMNLVAKEFVAARDDLDGVLILSELAGASEELAEALIINPYDERGFAAAILRAVEMPGWERRRRMRALRRRVAGRDVLAWASDLLGQLEHRKGTGFLAG